MIRLKTLRKYFGFLEKEKGVHSVLIFGSHAKNLQTERSDVDICIVAPKCKTVKDQANLLRRIWRKINAEHYDVRLFEELPLYIKIDVIKNHRIVSTRNLPELYYYFYLFRKLWQDQSINWMEKSH